MGAEDIEKSTAGPLIQKNSDLTNLNTLGVSVQATLFVEITDLQQLKVLYNNGFFKAGMPVVLGGGSNLLFLDNPKEPVVKISIPGRTYVQQPDGTVLVKIGAGENWHSVVAEAVEKNLGGIENLALIPGTTGAAPIQNIGAYGVELKDCFHQLTAFDIQTGTFRIFSPEECGFGYRDSIFKREMKGNVIICDVTLRLAETHHELNVDYGSLATYLDEKNIINPGIRDVFHAVTDIRKSKLPDPADIGNAGSFFKNPVVDHPALQNLQTQFQDIPFYKLSENQFKVPAAWLIEKAGWKGKRVGDVGTYKNQALVLVNHGGATGREIYNHALRIRDSVKEMFGVNLQPEVNIVGDDS